MNMNSKLWVKILISFIFVIVGLVILVNYIVDPYGLYDTNFIKNKPKRFVQMRLLKLIELRKQKPVSIVIGTSRADVAIDPEHEYFIKPSYNLSNGALSVYEAKYYIKEAIKLGVKNILFVADWRMFNDAMEMTYDFETYFNNYNIYKFLLNYKTLQDSFFTVKNKNIKGLYLKNGLIDETHLNYIYKSGGHLAVMKRDEKVYYKTLSNNNFYKYTNIDSFNDFRDILEMCYKNNINLDIIFGPSHIRQWEAFAYYKNYETFLKWKKDIVLNVEKIAKEQYKNPFRIIDFSVYHELTAEQVPSNPEDKMKYHWEGSHYKKSLGNIVLDIILKKNKLYYTDFGVVITSENIDLHLDKLRADRTKFINTKEYIKEVFGE